MPDLEPEYRAIIPTLEYSHKPGTGGVKCVLCGEPPEYREYNEHKRTVGPKRAVWLCSACHSKVMGNPDPEPPQEVQPTPQDIPADPIPEPSQNVENRDQNLEDRDQKSPETIPESPVSENAGTEPVDNGPEPENNGTEIEQTPPRPTPQVYTPKGEYTIPDVLGDVSLGIERDAVGFTYTFYRQGSPIGSQKTSKTPPWLSSKVVTDISAALFNACPDLGKVYTKEYFRETLGDVFKTLQNTIQTNPQAAALLMPPAITHILSKVDRVAITLFKDGLGGGEPVYELFTGRDTEDEPRTVTLSLADITAETPGMFKRRWTSVFVTDFLEMTRDDWVSLRRALIDRAEVREVEHTGEGDALISDLLQELRFLTFTLQKNKWKENPRDYLFCEHTPEGWLIYVNSVNIASFLKKNDITDLNAWTQKLSKACKDRDITAGGSKKIRVSPGPQGTVRVWVFKGDALGFHEDMLVEMAVTPETQNVPGSENVPGQNARPPEQTENGRQPEQETGGG